MVSVGHGRWEEVTATLRPHRLVAPPVTRLVAASIDLAIVILPSIAVALLAAERFAVGGPSGGPSRFTAADQARIDAIGDGLHRAVEVGGWLYTLDAGGLLVTGVVVLSAALSTHVAFPVLGGGRSPGKTVVGLRVVAADGRPADVGSHLLRTLAAPIDLFGLGVPGLLGALSAWGDADRRRLGDRLAETRVTRWPSEWLVAPTLAPSDQARERRPAPPPTGPSEAASTARPECPDLTEVPVAILLTDREDETGTGVEAVAAARPGTTSGPGTIDQPRPAPPLPPVRRLDGSPTRSPRSRRGATRADVEAVAAARPERSPDAGWLGGTADYIAWADPARSLAEATDVRPATASWSGASGRFDTLVLPESSLAEGPLITTAPVAPEGGTPDVEGDDLVIGTAVAAQPMWDRNREAWVYRDPGRGRWFRHDAATDRWFPIDSGDTPPAGV